MEEIIITELSKRNITFFREVNFKGCINPETGMELRYDFYLPDLKMIVEYDGKKYHDTHDVKKRDAIKTNFVRLLDINLVRVSGGVPGIDRFCKKYLSKFEVGIAKKRHNKQGRKSGKKHITLKELLANRQKEINKQIAASPEKPRINIHKYATKIEKRGKKPLGIVTPPGMSVAEYKEKQANLKRLKSERAAISG